MIRTKGEAGTGDIVNAVTPHARGLRRHPPARRRCASEELYAEAKELRAPFELVQWVAENGRLPVVTFTAGGIATPADAALCMQLGADGVFVGSGIFKSRRPGEAREGDRRGDHALPRRRVLARVSRGLGEPMVGISTPPRSLPRSCSRRAAGKRFPRAQRRPGTRSRSGPVDFLKPRRESPSASKKRIRADTIDP